MVSEKQREANQKNAQLSTGPKTQAGKDQVRGNALTHGLRAEAFDVLPNEDAQLFADRLDSWNRDRLPTNETEAELVRHLAVISWKRDRADRYENAILTRQMLDAINACDCEDDDSQALVEAAALASFDPGSAGERLRRYQFALQRDFLKTLDTLTKMRAQESKREKDAIGANKANWVQVAGIAVGAENGTGTGRVQPEPVPVSAPNEAKSLAPIKPNSPAPNKAKMEDVRQECRIHEPIKPNSPAPNKANFSGGVQVSSGSVAKPTDPPQVEFWPIGPYSAGWLDISCQKS